MNPRYEIHLEGEGFEVCAYLPYTFGDGSPMKWAYELRRHVGTIEEAAWLVRVPLHEAKRSFIGARP